MQPVEQDERRLSRSGARVFQFCPGFLVEAWRSGFILRERESRAEKGMQVRVGKVVNHLPDSPSAGAVRGIELAFGQPLESVTKAPWKLDDI
jgi:hypothetical protein